jgi:hypothetical protein
MAMSVEWRIRDRAEALVLVDPSSRAVSEVPAPDAEVLKSYLAVTGTLDGWRRSMAWMPVDGDDRDPERWGELVVSRAENGEVTFVAPELFWEGIHRWFRSRGVDYNA